VSPAVLADAIALIHALLIALVIGGALVATTPRVIPRFPRGLIVAYLTAVGGTLLSYLFTGDCLMTLWEKELRDQATPGGAYGETFIQHYFGFLPATLTQPEHFAPALGVVLAVTAWAGLHGLRSSKSSPLSDLTSQTTQQSGQAGVLKGEPEEAGGENGG
jgi:uncharacterized protein DUF2784